MTSPGSALLSASVSVAIAAVIVAVTAGTDDAPPPKRTTGATMRPSTRPTGPTVRSPTDRAVAQRRVPGRTNRREQPIASTANRRADLERNTLIDVLLKKLPLPPRWGAPGTYLGIHDLTAELRFFRGLPVRSGRASTFLGNSRRVLASFKEQQSVSPVWFSHKSLFVLHGDERPAGKSCRPPDTGYLIIGMSEAMPHGRPPKLP